MTMRRPLALAAAIAVVTAAVTAVSLHHELRAGATALTITDVGDVTGVDHRWAPDQPVFVLVLGSDARRAEGCGCTDAVHLIGIPAGGGSASMINIPRDTWITIPGVSGSRRINEAYQRGGPALAAKAVAAFTGVPVGMVVVTTFAGLTAMVDELGGITVDVPVAMRDGNSGAFFPKGPVHMNGAQALAFSRNRKGMPRGDFDRTMDQGILMISALAQLQANGSSAVDTMKYLGVLLRHTELDKLTVTDLYRLGRLALSVDPAKVKSVLMPGHAGMAGAASVVFADPPAAGLFADLADDGVLENH